MEEVVAQLKMDIEGAKFRIVCAWCGDDMGEKEGDGVEGVTSSICGKCLVKHFPGIRLSIRGGDARVSNE
ncbi:hypothetical protein ES703_34227 [subsurface metagenome]